MSETKPTKTPEWGAGNDMLGTLDPRLCIYRGKRIVAITMGGDDSDTAKAIVTACNSHDRLIGDKKKLVEALEDVLGWIDNWDPNFADDDEWPDTEDRARAALRLLNGDEKEEGSRE